MVDVVFYDIKARRGLDTPGHRARGMNKLNRGTREGPGGEGPSPDLKAGPAGRAAGRTASPRIAAKVASGKHG